MTLNILCWILKLPYAFYPTRIPHESTRNEMAINMPLNQSVSCGIDQCNGRIRCYNMPSHSGTIWGNNTGWGHKSSKTILFLPLTDSSYTKTLPWQNFCLKISFFKSIAEQPSVFSYTTFLLPMVKHPGSLRSCLPMVKHPGGLRSWLVVLCINSHPNMETFLLNLTLL